MCMWNLAGKGKVAFDFVITSGLHRRFRHMSSEEGLSATEKYEQEKRISDRMGQQTLRKTYASRQALPFTRALWRYMGADRET